MESLTLFYLFSISLFSVLFFVSRFKKLKKHNKKNPPPSPPSYPIFGHFHLLKAPIYRTLQDLSNKYGPIFRLKLGSIPVLFVSSPQLLEECFTKNDVVFANRPQFLIAKHIGYNFTTVGNANYGPHWRNLRRVAALEFFSSARLTAYLNIRNEENVFLLKDLFGRESSFGYRKVELRPRFSELAFNIAMRMATGKRYFGANVEDLEEAKRFRGIIGEITEVSEASAPNDFFKFLQKIDFQGFEKKLAKLQKRSNAFLQSLVDEIKNKRNETDEEGKKSRRTFVDTLLNLQESEPEYYTDDLIKGNILIILLGGTDTTSVTLEWVMTLLLNHPEVLEKVRIELDNKVRNDQLIDEAQSSELPYLQCVVNETLRLFPTAPLLVPHMSSDDCVVGGYDIPRGTMLMANVFALHRDPNVWEEPISFKPERFEGLESYNYKLMPFGMGRRQCPGAGLANRVMLQCVATLVQCFEWGTINGEKLDLSEGIGLTMPKKKPLEAICKPREKMIPVLMSL